MNNVSFEAFVDQASTALQRNDDQEAIAFFQKALNVSPQDASIINNIGVIYYKRGRYQKAKHCLQKASRLNPRYFDSHYNLAKVSIKLKDKKQAVACLEKCLLLKPEDEKAENLLVSLRTDNECEDKIHVNPPVPDKIDIDLMRMHTNQKLLGDLKDLKILHCPFEIAGNMNRIARMLRDLDVYARSVSYYSNWLNYQCDENLRINEFPAEEAGKRIDSFAKKAMDEYDIFHFHFNRSLYPDFRDLDILKRRDKKILFSF